MQIKEKENCVVIDSLHYTMTLAVPPAPSYFFYKKKRTPVRFHRRRRL